MCLKFVTLLLNGGRRFEICFYAVIDGGVCNLLLCCYRGKGVLKFVTMLLHGGGGFCNLLLCFYMGGGGLVQALRNKH